jgi:AcrR family transcriptional regulator
MGSAGRDEERDEPPGRRRAPRTPPAERRRQLLDVAEQLVAEDGTEALRMDAVARAAGVTRPVVYEHFRDRDALLVALLRRHAARVASHVAEAAAAEPSFPADLAAATVAYLEVACRSGPAMRALVSAEGRSPAIDEARRTYWGAAASRWADRYREYAGLAPDDALALATAHLAALSALAGLCMEGRLTVPRATTLHVTSALAALDALSRKSEETP